MSREPQS